MPKSSWSVIRRFSKRGSETEIWRPSTEAIAQMSRAELAIVTNSANIGDLFDAQGHLKLPDSLPPKKAYGFRSVTIQRRPNGDESVKILTRDKVAALKLLALESRLLTRSWRR